ncbi:MAG: hypothetical protein LUH04_19155, partial [Clostridium sp.]|nr:hypothetical protein [Clostridium sp.]
YLLVPGIRSALEAGESRVRILLLTGKKREIPCTLGQMTAQERRILLSGCLINLYAQERKEKDGGEKHER